MSEASNDPAGQLHALAQEIQTRLDLIRAQAACVEKCDKILALTRELLEHSRSEQDSMRQRLEALEKRVNEWVSVPDGAPRVAPPLQTPLFQEMSTQGPCMGVEDLVIRLLDYDKYHKIRAFINDVDEFRSILTTGGRPKSLYETDHHRIFRIHFRGRFLEDLFLEILPEHGLVSIEPTRPIRPCGQEKQAFEWVLEASRRCTKIRQREWPRDLFPAMLIGPNVGPECTSKFVNVLYFNPVNRWFGVYDQGLTSWLKEHLLPENS